MAKPDDLSLYCMCIPGDFLTIETDIHKSTFIKITQNSTGDVACVNLHRIYAVRLRDWLNQWLEETK